MGCVGCGNGLRIGALCRPCALEVAPCDGLIPDHLHSRVEDARAEAWVVDGFGAVHAIAATAMLGRNLDGDLVVLAGSVSRAHAELRRTGARWTVRDLASRNGTFVDRVRCRDEVVLADRAVLKIGDVALWFLARLAHEPPPLAMMTTGGATGGLICYQLAPPTAELRILASDGAGSGIAGGALLWRTAGAAAWSERSLTPLEFQLLRVLCARAYAEAASPSPVRGCVATKQLAHELPFQSKYANQENVRQVVLRVRTLLAEVGARDVVAAAPGRGYYLACPVSAAGARGVPHAAGAAILGRW